MYRFTLDLARLAPPPPELQQLIGALVGKPDGISAFVGLIAGSTPIPEFFDPENIGRLLGAAFASAG